MAAVIAAYSLCQTTDPEERLEDAALWKAMHDEYGDQIVVGERDGVAQFGRGKKRSFAPQDDGGIHYWHDPAFLENCQRRFEVVDFDGAEAFHKRQMSDGRRGTFLKSLRMKHYTKSVEAGQSLIDAMSYDALQFSETGALLMAQDLCEVTFEHRWLFLNRELVTWSPIHWATTPLDNVQGLAFPKPDSDAPVNYDDAAHKALACEVAKSCLYPTVCIDTAEIDGNLGVVEFNPFWPGQIGLYGCDVRAIARASRLMVSEMESR